jgi:hypothetical protein
MQHAPVQPPPMSEADAAEHIKEKHLQMVKNRQQMGREIPAAPVFESVVGRDLARSAVEASQKTMRQAAKKSFLVPQLPWKKG